MNPLIETWMCAVEMWAKEWPENAICKTWIKTGPKFLLVENEAPLGIFDICKYQNVNLKMTQLESQYLDKESFYKALEDLSGPAPLSDSVEISLIGDAKKGTAANRKHCLENIAINCSSKGAVLNFRSSDFIKKFLTDIYFVQQKVMKEIWNGAEKWPIMCNFKSIMLRSPFWFIYLEQVYKQYGEKTLRNRIEEMDPITRSFLRFYHKHMDSDINYKSLDRCRDRMEESECYPILKEYIENYQE